ncbi:SulP family inorganic anion transporter [Adhaeribacter radiodurans]|uniref:SulP family inorganic anion transporter n=1 Tax=Adhaeribacter radiodurans TaxID=2745197 RepID=A0A7L7L8F7_9BACT|nr:SulP family inorganic anion transporter [Adhaeribacter radiodurans]QMU29110.1 SulP family inorganic anion transporter [Adhaeribacter radiodurans]
MNSTNSISLKNLGSDLPAGLVVFLVALPLCLGISLASGAPLLGGVIAGVVGGIVVSLVSGSQLSVSGPAAGLTVIVLNGITKLGSFEAFQLAVVIAGVLQLILGFLKAGIIGHYFPSSVIKGMLAAIGLTLILKQIPHFLGADKDFFGEMEFFQFDGRNTFTEMVYAFEHIEKGALLVGVISLLIIVLWDKPRFKKYALFKFVPSALIAVIVALGINYFFKASAPVLTINTEHLVQLPTMDSWTKLVAQLTQPDWSALGNMDVYILAITIAIIASLETLLSVEAVDRMDPLKRVTPTNRELKAQGFGNFISGLLGGLPMTAVIVRSSANINAGGKTKVSAFFHGILLLISVLFLSSVLNQIPLSALAAVLLVVGFKLTKPSLYVSQFKLGLEQFIPFIVTILAILFTDLLIGISIGLAIGVFFILKANYKTPYFFHKEKHKQGEVIRLQLSENVSFLNKASILLTLHHLPDNSEIIVDGSKSTFIDYDVLDAIQNFKINAQERNIRLHLQNIPEVVSTNAH